MHGQAHLALLFHAELPPVGLLLQLFLSDASPLILPRQALLLTALSVVNTLGFDRTTTLALTCPPFIFAGAAGILFGWTSGRWHERTWHITVGLGIAIAGFILASATLNVAARYVSFFILAGGAYSVNSVIIGWASSTLSQTKEKKAVCPHHAPSLPSQVVTNS